MSSSALVPRAPIRRTLRRLRPLGFAVVALGLIGLAIATFVAVYTNWLWFDSVHHQDVYQRRLLTQVVMFVIFGGITALGTGATVYTAGRLTPGKATNSLPWLQQKWRALTPAVRRLLLAAVPTIAGLRAGFAAAGHWQLWLQWQNAVNVGRADPRFHRDYGYYLFDYPFHRYAGAVLTSTLAISIVALIVVAWLRGAVRLRGARPRTSDGFRIALAALLAVLSLVKAWEYWLDRYGTVVSSRGPVTGQSWTDLHVVLPMKFVLVVIALLLAGLFWYAAVRRSIRLTLVGVATMIVAGVAFGGIVPWLFQTLKVKPSAITAEGPSIARNIAATRFGFGIEAVRPVPVASTTSAGGRAAAAAVSGAVQPRLMDPNVIVPTITQLQQRTSYYRFKPTMDVDRYPIGGKQTDVVIGVRELNAQGLPRKTWTNQHLVYTHGIGVVAASLGQVVGKGLPQLLQSGIPSSGVLSGTTPLQERIYFGQYSPNYSIVGAPPGKGQEFDQPGETTASYSYSGHGGVPIASVWHRLLYALRFGDKNLLFASGFNKDSQLLYLRNPAARINAVAPWLSLDGDIYPVVADGHVTWVADGYTTSAQLPDSQRFNFRSATTTTYNQSGAYARQPSTPVNYIRNSVVATVDAYTGAVTLYQKPGAPTDPVLRVWEKSFPGLVKPASAIPAGLVPHLRYPQDLFNLQRAVLARYHGESPGAFYSTSQFWLVPGDPTTSGTAAQPSYYATTDVGGRQQFTLTSPLLTLNRSNIAAYLSVDSDENTPGYGQLQLRTIPAKTSTESPQQLQNDIESNPTIARTLSLERQGQSSVTLGNLQTVLVNGQTLAIEPIYEQLKKGAQRYPLLRHVVVVYGSNNSPGFADNFSQALEQTLGVRPGPGSASSLASAAQQALRSLTQAEASGNKAAAAKAMQQLSDAITQLQSQG